MDFSKTPRRLLSRAGPAPKPPPPQLATIYNKIGIQELSIHANDTLGGGNLRDVVKLPLGEDLNEWLAINLSDFFNQTSLLYGMASEECTAESCSTMKAGFHEYYWSDGDSLVRCPAPTYVDYLLTRFVYFIR